MRTNFDAVQIVNAINAELGGFYNYEFPIADSENFKAMSAAILNAPSLIRNAYAESLWNLVCNTVVKKVYRANNPFRFLYSSPINQIGDESSYVMEIAIDQFIPMPYELEASAERFFAKAPVKHKIQVLCNVLRKKYVVTINPYALAPALSSVEAFNDYLNAITDRLYQDMEEDDKDEIKAALNAMLWYGNMRLVRIAKPVDSTTSLAFATAIETLSKDLASDRSRDYNAQRLSTKTALSDAILILPNDVSAVQNKYNLAWAFDKTYLDLVGEGRLISVSSGSLADDNVFAIYADVDAFRIRPIAGFPILKQFENGDNLEEKRWLHNWTAINFSCSSNMVAFIKPEAVGVDSVEIVTHEGQTSGVSVPKGHYLLLGIPNVTPTDGMYADVFVTYSISGQTSDNTWIDKSDGTLWIAKDEEAATITITATSMLDNSKTGTLDVTITEPASQASVISASVAKSGSRSVSAAKAKVTK